MFFNSFQKQIPNFLTSFRCLSSVIVPIVIIYGDEIGAIFAPIVFIIAGITDFFDGYLARRFNVTSNFGKIIDPVADKMLIISTLIALSMEGFFDYYYTFLPVLFIVLREIFITGLREQTYNMKISLDVSILAKWKTTIQIIACSTFLIWRSHTFFFESQIVFMLSVILIWIAGIITIITCYDYLKKVWYHL